LIFHLNDANCYHSCLIFTTAKNLLLTGVNFKVNVSYTAAGKKEVLTHFNT